MTDKYNDTPDGSERLTPEDPETAGTCYSARGCEGKVLNHKDAHNCKLSGGKSWRSDITGTCYNL